MRNILLLWSILLCFFSGMNAAEATRRALILADKADEMPELRQLIQSGGWNVTQYAQKDWNISVSGIEVIVVYIHEPILEAVEKALIDYAEQGGRLVVVHHALASAKMRNPRWLELLGVKIMPRSDPNTPWFVSEVPAFTVVNLAPKHYITSHKVKYDQTTAYRSEIRKELAGEFPAFVLENSEVFHNQRNTDGNAKIPLLAYRLNEPEAKTLPTNVPKFDETAGWLKKTGKGWTIYLQPGHVPSDFRHPAFAQIVLNALAWKANDESDVAAAVEKLRAAMLSGKADDLSTIAANDLIYVHSDGNVETKAEFVENIASGRSVFVALDFVDQQIKISGDTAIVQHTMVAKTHHGGVPGKVKIGVLLTWQKQSDEWKLLGRQAQRLIVP